MSEIRYFTWLSEAIPKGNAAVNAVLEKYDSAKEFYDDFKKNPDSINFLAPNIKIGLSKTRISDADEILNRCERLGIKTVCCADEEYPKRLLDVYGVPPVLYYVGDVSLLSSGAAISVVGTRKALDKSKQITGSICRDLTRAGITVISGCAVGIDEYAHRGAVKARGKTVAVLGCGVDVNYPRKNARIKNKILKLGGLLVSEQPPGTRPVPANFPPRNRLIAGLSDSVFVVEAPEKSGALITAEHALSQGKEVFCLSPLGFKDKRFSGCVKYLRSGAQPVYDVSDIIYVYYLGGYEGIDYEQVAYILENNTALPEIKETAAAKPDRARQPAAKKERQENKQAQNSEPLVKKPVSGVSEKARELYENALSFEPKRAEELAEISKLSVAELLACLTELEIAGVCSQQAGNMYFIPQDK